MNTEEKDEWIASLESLLADVYTIAKRSLEQQGTFATTSPMQRIYSMLNAQDFTKRDGAS